MYSLVEAKRPLVRMTTGVRRVAPEETVVRKGAIKKTLQKLRVGIVERDAEISRLLRMTSELRSSLRRSRAMRSAGTMWYESSTMTEMTWSAEASVLALKRSL